MGPALFTVLPAFIALAVIFMFSLEAAFLNVYLPVLLLLPDGYLWGNPAMSAYQYAIIPIGVGLCWEAIRGRWQWSFTDIPVFGYLAWMIASAMHAQGHTDMLNHLVSATTLGIFPYLAGKLLIEQRGIRLAVTRRFISCLFFDALTCVVEFRLSFNPLRQLFNNIYSEPDPWGTKMRYGFGRSSGPFGHPIFMGTMSGIALVLHRYAAHFGFWERRFKRISNIPISKSQIIGWSLAAGSLMTLSRGPWLATVVGMIIGSIGLARARWPAFRRAVILLVVGGTLVYWSGKAYVSLSENDSSKEEASSAEYRVRLLSEYKDIATLRGFWGWGGPDWPRVKGMDSIDNWYLLVTLTYGTPGLYLFVGMLAVPAFHMLWAGMTEEALPDDLRALLFAQTGVLSVVAVSLTTVFLGSQLFPLLLLFLGWGDACLLSRPRRSVPVPTFEFAKVIA